MQVDIIFKIAGIGIIVAILHAVLTSAKREDQALMTSIVGLVVVLLLVIKEIGNLFTTVKSVFGL